MADRIPLTEAFDEMYRSLDAHAQKAIEVAGGVSCRKGCAHCCYLLTSLTPTEGISIAERLLRDIVLRPNLGSLLDDLRNNAIASSYKNITRENYFEKRLKCPFLKADNECSIYSFRPSMCRYHLVISPPEDCSPDAPKDVKTSTIDLIYLEQHVWKMDAEFMKSPVPVFAPISIVVLWAMKMIVDASDMSGEDGRNVKALVDKAVDGVISPLTWTMENFQHLVGDGSPPSRVPLKEALNDARKGR